MLYLYDTNSSLRELLYYGSAITELRGSTEYLSDYIDNGTAHNVLYYGVHIDCVQREIHYWRSDTTRELIDHDRLQAVWSDYKVFNHWDAFERQSELTGGRLQFKKKKTSDLITAIEAIVCRRGLIDHLKGFLKDIDVSNQMLNECDHVVELEPDVVLACKRLLRMNKESLERHFDDLFKNAADE